jgi:hypothetical protein
MLTTYAVAYMQTVGMGGDLGWARGQRAIEVLA